MPRLHREAATFPKATPTVTAQDPVYRIYMVAVSVSAETDLDMPSGDVVASELMRHWPNRKKRKYKIQSIRGRKSAWRYDNGDA